MDSSPDSKIETLTITTVVLGSCLLLVMAGLLALCIRGILAKKGKAKPPSNAPAPNPLHSLMDLTIVVTDIECSTGLWESVDAEAMNKTLNQHHSLIRRLLKTHGGQEAATEGDSFILSFPNPQNALDFSLDLQSQLMELDYVEPILKHPICTPVWMKPSSFFVKRHGREWRGEFGLLDATSLMEITTAPRPSPATHSSFASESQQSISSPRPRSIMKLSKESFNFFPSPKSAEARPSSMNNDPLSNTSAPTSAGTKASFLNTFPFRMRPPSSMDTSLEVTNQMGPKRRSSGQINEGSETRDNSEDQFEHEMTNQPQTKASASTSLRYLRQMSSGLHGGPSSLIHHHDSADNNMVDASRLEMVEQPPLSSLASTPVVFEVKTITAEGYIKSLFHPSQPPSERSYLLGRKAEAPLLAFKGLRVRVGLHCPTLDEIKAALVSLRAHPGVMTATRATPRPSGQSSRRSADDDFVVSMSSKIGPAAVASLLVGGEILVRAKQVADAGAGGMILISPSCYERIRAYEQLLPSSKEKKAKQRLPSIIICMGSHVLKKPGGSEEPIRPLVFHQAISPSLSPRLTLFCPMRTQEKLELDALDAPLGQITIAFANVVGVPTLMAWDQERTRHALDIFASHATMLLKESQGYIVEMTQDGLCLAAFAHPLDAIVWAAGLIELLKHADWDKELLEHELCEELALPHSHSHEAAVSIQGGSKVFTPTDMSRAQTLTGPQLTDMIREIQEEASHHFVPPSVHHRASPSKVPSRNRSGMLDHHMLANIQSASGLEEVAGDRLVHSSSSMQDRPRPHPAASLSQLMTEEARQSGASASQPHQRIILLRGPRVKIGIDEGLAAAELSPVTGRMIYRGKFMNRAARISAKAPSGTCWCSEGAWEGAKEQATAELISSLGLVGDRLGPFQLKGVQEEVNLFQCSFSRAPVSIFARMAEAQTLKMPQMIQGSYYKPPSLIIPPRAANLAPPVVKIEVQEIPESASAKTRRPVKRAATRMSLLPDLDRISPQPALQLSKRQHSLGMVVAFEPDSYYNSLDPDPTVNNNPGVKYMQVMNEIERGHSSSLRSKEGKE